MSSTAYTRSIFKHFSQVCVTGSRKYNLAVIYGWKMCKNGLKPPPSRSGVDCWQPLTDLKYIDGKNNWILPCVVYRYLCCCVLRCIFPTWKIVSLFFTNSLSENMLFTSDPKPISHTEIGRYFMEYTGYCYIPNQEKQHEYPDDVDATNDYIKQYTADADWHYRKITLMP